MVGLGGVTRAAIDARGDGLALAQRPALELDIEGLVLADSEHVAHARDAVAVVAFDRAFVGDLAPSGA